MNGINPKELAEKVDFVKKDMTEQTLQGLTGAGVNSEFIEPVRNELFKNIVAGTNSVDVEQALRNMIEGDSVKLGGLSKHVGQVARDALNQYDGTVNARIAEEFGLDAFQYVGSLIEDSRSQCRRWVAKEVLLKENLPSEISWANNNGQGMIPGTNAENFAVFRGGYNCRHQAIPFKLTSREKERLNKKEEEEEEEFQDLQIKEIEESIKLNDERKDLSAKKVNKTTKSNLDGELYVSTQSKKTNENFLKQFEDTDGASEIANEFKTNVTLRTNLEAAKTGTRKFLEKTGREDLNIYSVGYYKSSNIGGFCSISNRYMSVKMNKKDVIDFKKVEAIQGSKKPFYPTDENVSSYYEKTNEAVPDKYFRSSFYVAKLKGRSKKSGRSIIEKRRGTWKFHGVDEMLNKSTNEINNQTVILTHETGHLIQNKYDLAEEVFGKRIRPKMEKLMKKRGIGLSDSLTWYGETNQSELFAESFAAYVHGNKEFKISNPKLFDFMEELLFDVYKIDKKSIKIAK